MIGGDFIKLANFAHKSRKKSKKFDISTDIFFYFLFFLLSILSTKAYFSDNKKPQIISIIHTDEINGNIYPRLEKTGDFKGQYSGGLGLLTSQIKSIKQKNQLRSAINVLFDAGSSFYGGNAFSDIEDSENIMAFMNSVQYDAIGIGNSDFDFGPKQLFKTLSKANFPIVNSNLKNVPSQISPFSIFIRKGIKIGVLALINNDLESIVPKSRLGAISLDKNINTIKDIIQLLNSKKCDLIIVLSDLYDTQKEIELAQTFQDSIDVIISTTRDSQDLEHHMMIGDVSIVKTPKYLEHVGELELFFDPSIKKIIHRNWKAYPVVSSRISPDPQMTQMLKYYKSKKEPTSKNKIIGHNLVDLKYDMDKESIFGDFVTDLIRNKYKSDLVLINSFNLRGIPAGPITISSIEKSIPYNDELVLLNLRGDQIKLLFENNLFNLKKYGLLQQSGASFKYDMDKAFGKRIEDFALNNGPIIDNKIYSVLTTIYLHQGNDGHSILQLGQNLKLCNEKLQNLLQKEIIRLGEIHYQSDNRMQDCTHKNESNKNEKNNESLPTKFFKRLFSFSP